MLITFKKKIFGKFIYSILLLLPTVNALENTLSISISTLNIKGSCAATILNKAYGEMGYQLKFHFIPAQRALVEANKDHLDGVMNRVKGLEKYYPNLARIATPILKIDLLFICLMITS